MNRKFIWLIVSCLLVAALVLASCGPAPVVEEKKATVVTKEAEKKVEKVEEVVAKPVGPQYGGMINTSSYWEVSNFDNVDAIWQTRAVMSFTHDQLTRGDWYIDREIWDWIKPGGVWVEAYWLGTLAETWDVLDPLTIIFNLRKGVRWQNLPPVNGREFVANDVIQHFTRLLASPRFVAHPLQAIEKMTATDKYTVRMDLSKADFALLMTITKENITAHELWETYGDLRHWTTTIGTGPFILEDFVLGSSLTFKRNPDWWAIDPTTGNQLPYVDGVRNFFIPESATMFAALRTGKLDHQTAIPWTQKDALTSAAPELSWEVTPDSSIFSLWLKNTIEPFNNVKVRQALWMAIDRQALCDALFPPGLATLDYAAQRGWKDIYIPFDELTETAQMVLTYDPVAAKALLADAGYPSGLKTCVQYHTVGGWAWAADGLAVVKEYWDVIGVDLELKPVDAATISAFRYAPFPYEQIMGVGGGWVSVSLVWENLQFKVRTGAPWNRALVSDPYIDDLIEKIGPEFDEAKRNVLFKAAYLRILEQAYWINLPGGAKYKAWWPWFKGYLGEGSISYHDGDVYAHVWLDQDLRYEMTGKR